MAEVVQPGDVRIRIYETPAVTAPPPDIKVLLDSPSLVSPGNMQLPELLNAQILYSDHGTGQPQQAAQAVLVEASRVVVYPLSDVIGRGRDFYLGPFPVAPTTGNNNLPLVPGNTYFNTNDKNTYVWNGASWQVQGLPQPATLKNYTWYLAAPGAQFPPMGSESRDDLGELFAFDPTKGDTLSIFVNGVKQSQADYFFAIDEDGATTVNLYVLPCASSIVEITVFLAHTVSNYISPVSVNTGLWQLDGVEIRFPLRDYAGKPLAPASANDCLLWYGYFTPDGLPIGQLLDPAKHFTIVGDSIVFGFPPYRHEYGEQEASIWMQVGVPLMQPPVLNALSAGLASSGDTSVLEAAAGVALLASGVSPAFGVEANPTTINQLTPVTALPTPDETHRGEFMLLTKEGAGDQLVICMKNADNTYGWRALVYAA